ncbi:DUF2840 domain-containing protein [Hyphomonas oceanitis]|uniref:DUF2840 domain-containing protein n=1 Tax=Hyphomonas oceanitis TaxID=81033 RepID=UPI003AB92068
MVAEAGQPVEQLTRTPGIITGAHLLLHAFGMIRSRRALRAIDVLSDAHILHETHPAYWRHAHAQFTGLGQPERRQFLV